MCVGYQPLSSENISRTAVSKNISFEVQSGEILAIMGPSGAGKSTLLRGLLGRAPHVTGKIWVNGHDCSDKGGLGTVSHRVGLVPQSDVLVDELSMRENIQFFHTIAVDSGLDSQEVAKRADQELAAIGLTDDNTQPGAQPLTRKRIGDGSGRKSHISGGQAKRANIAMELVNDPDVLIIDEPTSGLSSQDSLELVKKLKAIAATGKIVIIIIHQPSSEVFQLFDRLLLLDGGGNCVRSGPREEVVRWLSQFSPDAFHCEHCANAFPDRVMEVIETRGPARSPGQPAYWETQSRAFAQAFEPRLPQPHPLPERPLLRPLQAWRDLAALLRRNLVVKNRDRFSTALTYLVPPVLGALFAAVFSAAPAHAAYTFHQNSLFPQLVFMLIVCALFLGMVSSAVEVIKDRPMLEREASRGLRMWAYFGTKYVAIMAFGTIQVLLLVTSAAWTLGAMHLFGVLFWSLLLVMALGVSTGLLISVFSSTATKAFNLVPLVLLPQIVLGGALLPYDGMGAQLYLWEDKRPAHRPLVAAAMPSSWAHQMAMRAIYDASKDRAQAMNVAVADMRHIETDGFMGLRATRQLQADPLAPWVQAPDWWASWRQQPQALDVLVLLAITAGSLGLGWIWVGKPYQIRSRDAWRRRFMTGVVLAGLPACLVMASAPDTRTQQPARTLAKGVDFMLAPHPMDWGSALRHCTGLKAKVASLEEFLAVHRENAGSFGAGPYWVALAQGNPARPAPALLSTQNLQAMPTPRRYELPAVMAARNVVQTRGIQPQQGRRFVCIPLPRILPAQ